MPQFFGRFALWQRARSAPAFPFWPGRLLRLMVEEELIVSAPLLEKRHSPGTETGIQLQTGQVEPWHDSEWQRLWLSIQSRPWSSLALIPAGDGASLDFSLIVAMTLSRTGMVHMGSPIQVADATRVPLNQLTAFTNEVARCTSNGQRLLVALPPAHGNAITSTIAQSLDAAVLCILASKMSSNDAKRTVKLIGPSRFLGSAIFHPHQIVRP